LLERLREKSDYFGKKIDLNYNIDYPLAYAVNESEFESLLRFLEEDGEITAKRMVDGFGEVVSLKASGYEFVDSLKADNKKSEQAFIAVWFDDSMSGSIDVMEGAVKECGFTPMCIRDEHFSERIMDKALGEIRKSRFIIIDLTGGRKSVYFEAGFSHGLGVEQIFVYKRSAIKDDESLDFYVKHYQCYGYDKEVDLRGILINAIRARMKK
jgi:hypothetical protein